MLLIVWKSSGLLEEKATLISPTFSSGFVLISGTCQTSDA
jgi:hypothetical protein